MAPMNKSKGQRERLNRSKDDQHHNHSTFSTQAGEFPLLQTINRLNLAVDHMISRHHYNKTTRQAGMLSSNMLLTRGGQKA